MKILYIFDIRYWKLFCSPQNAKNNIMFSTTAGPGVSTCSTENALILTIKLISFSSDGKKSISLWNKRERFSKFSFSFFLVNFVF